MLTPRRLASNHAMIIGQLSNGNICDVTVEIYDNGRLKWLEIGGAYCMYIDQVEDIVKITAPYADSAFAKIGVNTRAVGEVRYITKIFTDKSVNYPC